MSRLFRSAPLLLAALAALPLAPAQSAGIGWVPVTPSDGQGLRIGLVNLVDVDAGASAPACRGTVTFYDAAGRPIAATSSFELDAGRSLGLASTARTVRRAVVRFARPPQADRAGVAAPDPCRAVFAGAEVYELQTGRTAYLNPGVIRGFDPQPEPPAFGFAE